MQFQKWKDALASLGSKTSLILNSDDPQIAYLGDAIKNEVKYFGVKGRKYKIPNMLLTPHIVLNAEIN